VQGARVVVKPGKDLAGASALRARVNREAGSKRERAFFEPLDAEQFVAKWFVG
jgi:hypothetical protein